VPGIGGVKSLGEVNFPLLEKTDRKGEIKTRKCSRKPPCLKPDSRTAALIPGASKNRAKRFLSKNQGRVYLPDADPDPGEKDLQKTGKLHKCLPARNYAKRVDHRKSWKCQHPTRTAH